MSVIEGAGSIIEPLADGWVRKTMKRSAKRENRRNHTTIQYSLQNWCYLHLTPENGYQYLFAPEVRGSTDPQATSSYEMRQVSTKKDPWFLDGIPPLVHAETRRFQEEFKKGTGYTLYDVELYPQPDGRVAVLDFDQCYVSEQV